MENPNDWCNHPSSFRDPDASIKTLDSELVRVLKNEAAKTYLFAQKNGIIQPLEADGFLIPHHPFHTQQNVGVPDGEIWLKPETLELIKYPWEWTFDMWKDAALLTLEIQQRLLTHGMSLKDASAYNIQFRGTKPVFIDLGSLEKKKENEPWRAYLQFCMHFLAPLVLMSKVNINLGRMFLSWPDGIPLDIASDMLSFKNKLNLSIFSHITLQSGVNKSLEKKINVKMSKTQISNLITNLTQTIRGLKPKNFTSEWKNYRKEDSPYSKEALQVKKETVSAILSELNPDFAVDLGGHDLYFHQENVGKWVVIDSDEESLNQLYKNHKSEGIFIIKCDLTNPTSQSGWMNTERLSLFQRLGNADCVLCLGLIHHLFFNHQLNFNMILELIFKLGSSAIIEFPDENDPKVLQYLARFPERIGDWNVEKFEEALNGYSSITSKNPISDTNRVIYWVQQLKAEG